MEHQIDGNEPLYCITTTLQKADFRSYLYWLSLVRTCAGLVKIISFSVVLALIFTIALFPGSYLFFIAAFFALLILYTIVFVLTIELQLLRNNKLPNPLPIGKSRTYCFYEDGIGIEGKEKRMAYEKFTSYIETKTFFALYYRQETLLLIKKVDILKGQFDAVFAFLKEKLAKVYHKGYK